MGNIASSRICAVFAILIVVLVCACAGPEKNTPAAVRSEMRDVYKAANELYWYVWSPDKFMDDQNHERILRLLNRLSDDFHKVAQAAPRAEDESSFRIALVSQQSMLRDVRERFASGEKKYANWHLRGLINSCVSCHSRFGDETDFWGGVDLLPEDRSFDARLAAAEFLVASRQFDTGAAELMRLAKESAQVPSGTFHAIEALKRWLVVEVRVKERFGAAAERLSELLGKSAFGAVQRGVLEAWITDLDGLEDQGDKAPKSPLARAQMLLAPVMSGVSVDIQERKLVRTLRATALLHGLLRDEANGAVRREAALMLAVAYSQMPINTLEVFSPMYLERCILEFPGTKEAKRAYEFYRERLEFLSSGSGGLHIEDEDAKKLAQLKSLAYDDRRTVE